jgi:hypothetical protein
VAGVSPELGTLAQLEEQDPLKVKVLGSIPRRPTTNHPLSCEGDTGCDFGAKATHIRNQIRPVDPVEVVS